MNIIRLYILNCGSGEGVKQEFLVGDERAEKGQRGNGGKKWVCVTDRKMTNAGSCICADSITNVIKR